MRRKATQEDKDRVTENVPYNLETHKRVEELMCRIVHLNDDSREPISKDAASSELCGSTFLKRSFNSDQIELVEAVVKK